MPARRGAVSVVVALMVVLVVPAAQGATEADGDDERQRVDPRERRRFEIEVLSSPAEYISGGDARTLPTR